MEKAQDRLEVLAKIEEFEKRGAFDIDPENDPPFTPLKPGQFDYLRKKLSSKIKRALSYKLAKKYIKKLEENKILVLKEVIGLENLDKVKTGAIVTCNHFSPLDSFVIYNSFESKLSSKKRMFKIIREGNIALPGFYGFLMNNNDTLPLSKNKEVLKQMLNAVDTLLNQGHYVLVYPEQAMWWNYKKPRPFKERAFKFACKNKVPVIPCFITMKDTENLGPDGFYIQEFTMHILQPIYPNEEKTIIENAKEMCRKNYQMCVDLYEKVYDKKLEFITE